MRGPWLWGAPQSTPRTKAPWRSSFLNLKNVFIFPFFWLPHAACGIFVTRPGIAMVPPALEAQSLNRQAPREEVLPLGDFRCHCGALPKCQASASLGGALGVQTLALRDRCWGLLSWGDPVVAVEHVEPERAEAGHSTGPRPPGTPASPAPPRTRAPCSGPRGSARIMGTRPETREGSEACVRPGRLSDISLR